MTRWLPLFLAPQILGYFDYAFTSIFTVEILLKVTNGPPIIPPVTPTYSPSISAAHLSCFHPQLPSLPRIWGLTILMAPYSPDDSVWGFPAPWLLLP